MLTVIIPHITRKESILDIKKKLEPFRGEDLEIVLASYEGSKVASELEGAKASAKGVSVTLKLFRNNVSEESMIDACLRSTVAHEVVVVRQKAGIDSLLIQRLLGEIRRGADVAMPRAQKKKNAFKKLGEKFVKTFMNINFYEGDINLEAFSSRALSVLKLGSSTLLTKTNKFVGMTVGYVDVDEPPAKYSSSPVAMAVSYVLFALTLGATITLGVLGLLPWLAFMGLLLAMIVTLTFGAYFTIKYSVKKRLGEISAEKVGTIDSVEKRI